MKGLLSFVGATATAAVLLQPGSALGHVCLDVPTSRAAAMCKTHEVLEAAVNVDQKVGPCGSKNKRSATPTVYKPGQTITVKWTETIDHQPSWYRISFNPNGDSFEDPTSYQDNTGKHPNTLKDGIADGAAAMQEIQVTLPNMPCENCTLQLIQVMGDKGGNGFGGNDGEGGKADNDDLYYACADIVLRADGAAPIDAGASDASSLGAGSDAGAGAGAPDAAVGSDAGGSTSSGGTVGGGTAGGGTTGGGAIATGADAGSTAGGAGGATGSTGGLPVVDGGVSTTGGTAPVGPVADDDDGGCAVTAGQGRNVSGWMLALLGLALARRRRARG